MERDNLPGWKGWSGKMWMGFRVSIGNGACRDLSLLPVWGSSSRLDKADLGSSLLFMEIVCMPWISWNSTMVRLGWGGP